MTAEDPNTLLTSTSKEVDKAKGELAKLWRVILKDLGVTPMVWHRLMQNFLNNPANGIAVEDGKRRSSTRGNLNKALFRPIMSWKTLVSGLRILNPIEVEFEIRLKWRPNKRITVHTTTINLMDLVSEEYDSEENGDSDESTKS